MQRALVSVDDLTQTLTRIIDLANDAMNDHDLPQLRRIAGEAEDALERAETGEE